MSIPAEPCSSPESEVITEAEMKEAEQYLGKDNFIRMHKTQFQAMRLPTNLVSQLYDKLLAEQFDAAESLQVQWVEDEGFRVVASRSGGLRAGEDVWILDHMWTTSLAEGPRQLREIEGLVDRLWNLADMDTRMERERLAAREAAAEKSSAAPAAAATASQAGESTAATASSAAVAAPAAAAASSVTAAALTADEDTLCAIMSSAHVSRARAQEAYAANKGDLLCAIAWCAGDTAAEAEMKNNVTQIVEAQAAAQGPGVAADAASAAAAADNESAFDSSLLSREQKASLLWPALFRAGLVGSYFTTLANEMPLASLTQDQVQAVLYVNDELGSAVAQASHSADANAVMAPLVCVTLGGVAFSVMWITRDVAEGEEVLIQKRPTIRLPGVPQ